MSRRFAKGATALGSAIVVCSCGGAAFTSSPEAGADGGGGDGTVAEAGGREGGMEASAEASQQDAAADVAQTDGPSQVEAGCTNINSDPHNCGLCGHDCLGAMCASGVCTAAALSTGENAPWGIVVDATNVYFADTGTPNNAPSFGDGSVRGVPKNGGPVNVLAQLQTRPTALALDGATLYWAGGIIGSVPTGGGPPTTLTDFSNLTSANALTLDSIYLYYLTRDGTVYQTAKTGQPLASTSTMGNPASIAVDANNVYWANIGTGPTFGDGSVYTIPLSFLGGGKAIATSQTGASGVALNGTSLFWALSYGNGSILSYDLTTRMTVQLRMNLGHPSQIAVDAQHIYWTDWGTRAVMRARLDGSELLQLANGGVTPGPLVVDDSYVYWTDAGTFDGATGWFDQHDGQVLKVAK